MNTGREERDRSLEEEEPNPFYKKAAIEYEERPLDFGKYKSTPENPATLNDESEELLFIDDEDENEDSTEKEKEEELTRFKNLDIIEDENMFTNKQNLTFREQNRASSSLIKISKPAEKMEKSRAESGYQKRKMGTRHTYQVSRRVKGNNQTGYKISLTPTIQNRASFNPGNKNHFRDSSLNSKSQKNKIGSLKSTVTSNGAVSKNPFGYNVKKKSLRNFGIGLKNKSEKETAIMKQLERAQDLENRLRKLKRSFENSKNDYSEKFFKTQNVLQKSGEKNIKASFYDKKNDSSQIKWK